MDHKVLYLFCSHCLEYASKLSHLTKPYLSITCDILKAPPMMKPSLNPIGLIIPSLKLWWYILSDLAFLICEKGSLLCHGSSAWQSQIERIIST